MRPLNTRALLRLSRLFLVQLALVQVTACKNAPPDTKNPPASPQASASPAPISTNTDAGTRLLNAKDGGAPPVLHNAELPFPVDLPLAKEPSGLALRAYLRFADAPPIPRIPELNAQNAEAQRRRLDPSAEVTLSPSRMKIALRGGFVLPNGTEIRSRADVFGHIVSLDGRYRVAVPGSLRAVFNEGRFDAAPLLPGTSKETGVSAKRLGFVTRKVEVTTRAGKVTIELAKVPEANEGGILLCRFLLDLLNGAPDTTACDLDEVPLRAEYHWATRGVLFFEVTELKRVEGTPLLVPPSTLPFSATPFPPASTIPFAGLVDIGALRSGPQDLDPTPPSKNDRSDRTVASRGNAEIVNSTDAAWSIWLDGVPIGWVAPSSTLIVPQLYRGKYQLLTRSFLGGRERPLETVVLPGRAEMTEKPVED